MKILVAEGHMKTENTKICLKAAYNKAHILLVLRYLIAFVVF
jgi:hypothetical protein